MRKIRITEVVPIGRNGAASCLLFIEVGYAEGPPESYVFPISYGEGDRADRIIEERPHVALARLRTHGGMGIIFDAAQDDRFRNELLSFITRRKTSRGTHGDLIGYPGRKFRQLEGPTGPPKTSTLMKGEQSNSSFSYENRLILKLYRKVDEGLNPDPEITRFLSEKTRFAYVPQFAGAIDYIRKGASPVSIGHLQGYVQSQGDAWKFTLDSLSHYFERVLSRAGGATSDVPEMTELDLRSGRAEAPEVLRELIGPFYLEMAALLGKRTAELHRALSTSSEPAFEPEQFTTLYQRSLYQSMRNLSVRVFQFLRTSLRKMPSEMRAEASELLGNERQVIDRFQMVMRRKISAVKIRYHGDYHLGQILFTGNDFVILDFEGEPARPLSERRLKRSPLRDVAGMIRSFHYATSTALLQTGSVRTEDIDQVRRWADLWYHAVSDVFIHSYLERAGDTVFIPGDPEDLEILLRAFLLEKAVYELGYELNNRPDWAIIPIRGIEQLLSQKKEVVQ